MVAKVYFWLMIIFGCGCFTNQNALGLLDVPQINEAPDEVSNSSNELSTNDSSLDLIALKMRFKQQDNPYGEIYDLKNYAFVVSNNSRICPEQNCKFDIEETSLNPQPGTSRYGVSGTMKVDTGDVKKIFGIYSDFTPTEEREKNGQTIETVEGDFSNWKRTRE